MRRQTDIHRDHTIPGLVALYLLLLPAAARACPVCFGEPDSNQAYGLQAAILVLGSVTGLVVAGIAGVVITIHRRAGRQVP